jgi:hypothetical protein
MSLGRAFIPWSGAWGEFILVFARFIDKGFESLLCICHGLFFKGGLGCQEDLAMVEESTMGDNSPKGRQ